MVSHLYYIEPEHAFKIAKKGHILAKYNMMNIFFLQSLELQLLISE